MPTSWLQWDLMLLYLQLNDLMIMAVKYQVFQCKRPQDLLLITLNHVDEIRNFLLGDSHASDLLDHTHSLLFNVRHSSRVSVVIVLTASLHQQPQPAMFDAVLCSPLCANTVKWKPTLYPLKGIQTAALRRHCCKEKTLVYFSGRYNCTICLTLHYHWVNETSCLSQFHSIPSFYFRQRGPYRRTNITQEDR